MKNFKHYVAFFIVAFFVFGFVSCKHDSTPKAIVDLSGATGDLIIQDGSVVKGILPNNVKVSIAEGATVTFGGLSINADGNWTGVSYAGLTCIGDATIILKDDSTNTVKGFYGGNPRIYIPENKTLTIKGETAGTGALVASGAKEGYGAGIGGGHRSTCGTITIADIVTRVSATKGTSAPCSVGKGG